MAITSTISEIEAIYRLGPPIEGKTRPVIVKFVSSRKMFASPVLAQTKRVRNTEIYVTKDLTKEQNAIHWSQK